MRRMTGYIGTYASPESRGVYRFDFDPERGALGRPQLYCEAPDAKCAALWQGRLAFPLQRAGRAGLCLVDASGPKPRPLGEVFCERRTACFVAWREGRVYAANYHEGCVLIYEAQSGLRPVRRVEIAPRAGCHQVLFCEKTMLVPCLERDEIRLFDLARGCEPAGALAFPEGSGPRHGLFDRAGNWLYVLTERSNEIFSFRVEPGGGFAPAGRAAILEAGAQGAAAAIRLSPDGRFLYASARGANRVTAFAVAGGSLHCLQRIDSAVRHPRDFVIAPDGRHLIVAGRESGELACLRLDPQSGRIGPVLSRVPAPQAVGVILDETEFEGD